MLPMTLSDRLRGELESLLALTPSAKEWCRARALLWLADGRPVAEVAELLLVSRQSVYNWADRFERREGPRQHPSIDRLEKSFNRFSPLCQDADGRRGPAAASRGTCAAARTPRSAAAAGRPGGRGGSG